MKAEIYFCYYGVTQTQITNPFWAACLWRADLHIRFTSMEKFPATIAKLIGAIARLSIEINQLQATLAMMAIRSINLENDHHGDNYQGEG